MAPLPCRHIPLRTRDTTFAPQEKVHEQSLTKPAPPRPAPLEDEQKLERLSTKGHFNTKPAAEVEQFLHQSAQLREQFPERELAKLEEEVSAARASAAFPAHVGH